MDEIVVPSLEVNQQRENPGFNAIEPTVISSGAGNQGVPSQEARLESLPQATKGQQVYQTSEGTFVIQTGVNTQTTAGTRFGENCEGAFTIQCLSSIGLVGIIPLVMAYAFILAGVLSVLFIFWGGITFILSGGDDEKVKKSVNTIRYAIIGFIVAVFSYFLVGMIGNFLGINIGDFVSYDQILSTIKSLTPAVSTEGQ